MSERRYCFVGDSLVLGTCDDENRGWPGRIAAMLDAGYRTIYNLGIRSDTSEDIAARWDGECTARMPPDFEGRVAFGFGSNDCCRPSGGERRVPLKKSLENAQRLMGMAQARGWAPIWIGPMPIGGETVRFRTSAGHDYRFCADEIADFDAAAADLSAREGLPYLSLMGYLVEDTIFRESLVRSDSLHPTAEGYTVVAEHLARDAIFKDWFIG